MDKRCTRCKEKKTIDMFNKKKNNTYTTFCKECLANAAIYRTAKKKSSTLSIEDKKLKKLISAKISSCRSQDKKYGRIWKGIDEYVDYDWIINQLDLQEKRCDLCDEDLSFYIKGDKHHMVISRADITEPYTWNNIELICFHCSKTKKRS